MSQSSASSPHLPGDRVAVLLPLPLGSAYDYVVADYMTLADGDFVTVPLGARQAVGVVWGAGRADVEDGKLKEVLERLPAATLPAPSRAFVDWAAAYTLHPAGAVLKMVMSVPDALRPAKTVTAYAAVAQSPEIRQIRMTPARRRVLDVLEQGPPRPAVELAREAAVGTSVVKGLAEAGLLAAVDLPPPPLADPDPARPGPTLSDDQATAAGDLVGKAGAGGFSVTVLDGVPGSGKTEVYFEAAAKVLEAGKQVLVLLPEIALGAQWLARFSERFGAAPAQWHSDLTAARRRDTWRDVIEGRAKVVVGARSALFLPFQDLGLVVVDEEHDASYKQEEGVVYNARDMAVVRARIGEIPIVLVSATPSLESVVNAEAERYEILHLPARHGGAAMPKVEAIDMRSQEMAPASWLSAELCAAVSQTLEGGGQAMLFLNRRGYAPLTLCRTCGHRMQCPQCTAWLVEHRRVHRLQCHHCGYRAPLPRQCPSCQAEDSFAACGPGVERLAEEAVKRFPEARSIIAASDTVQGPVAAGELVRKIEDHEVDLIIGTQIVAKGYHFPLLTLVGVVDADLGLAGGDLRASERTFQLLYQVAGRAGRAQRPGRVLLQTYMPEHPVMKALVCGERARFLDTETQSRRENRMPPFGRLTALIVSGRDERAVEQTARTLSRVAPRGQGVRVLGPAPAPLYILRGKYRQRLLLKADRSVNVQDLVRRWLAATQIPRKVRVQVDVDPYSFL